MNAPVQVGDVVAGKYEVERILASGGMGVVVAARHQQLDQRVALKFMLPELMHGAVTPDALEHFIREGRAAVRLRGENVARVLDVGSLDNGTPYLVMEFLEGMDLNQHLARRRPLPLSEAVDYILQACVAMAEAHRGGLVHRDLKPENLFLTRRPDGSPLVKVLDFGISKLFAMPGQEQSADRSKTAGVMGSPGYMSPEQIRSTKDVDERTDIWALGVILYECTAGQRPYSMSGSAAEILARILYEEPRPLASAAPHLPEAFCDVVARCLQKQPAMRYQNVGELTTDLLPYASKAGRAAGASVHAMIGGSGQTVRRTGSMPTAKAEPSADMDLTPMATRASTSLGAAASRFMKQAAADNDAPLELDLERVQDPPVMDVVRARPSSAIEAVSLPGKPSADRGAGALPRAAADRNSGPLPRAAADRNSGKLARPASEPDAGTFTFDARRIAYIAAIMALGPITVITAFTDLGSTSVDRVQSALHRLGQAVSASYEVPARLLGGTLVQLVLPCLLALLLWWRGLRFAATVCLWWLGSALVHIGRYMAGAIDEHPIPIVGDIHVWQELLIRWRALDRAGEFARILHWTGVAVMVGAFVLMLYKTVRADPD